MTKHPVKIYSTPRRLIVAWVVSFLCMLGLTGGSMMYATYVDRRSNQNWCELIVSLDDGYKSLPPDAPARQRDFAERINRLRRSLEC